MGALVDGIELIVNGSARPAGALAIGKRKDGSQFLRHRSSGPLRYWQSGVADKAAEEMNGCAPSRDAVRVEIWFYVTRPKGHYGKRGLRPSAPAYPVKRSAGDIDKLARAVLDGLTGVAFADDSQVIDLQLRKRYADGVAVHARVHVREVGDELDLLHQQATTRGAA